MTDCSSSSQSFTATFRESNGPSGSDPSLIASHSVSFPQPQIYHAGPTPAHYAERHEPYPPRYTWTGPAHGEAKTSQRRSNSNNGTDPGLTVEQYWGGTPVLDVSPDTLPDRWMRFVHLDGGCYFFDPRHRVVTPEDITQSAVYDKYKYGWQTLVVKGFDDPDGPLTYIMDYETGTYTEIRACGQDLHGMGIRVEFKTERFWNALRDFPMHIVRVPRDIDVDFLGALSFGASERILEWNDTTYPFTDEQTRRLVQVYRDVKYDLDRGLPVVPAFTYHIARTMNKVEDARSKAKFGTSEATLYRSVISHEVTWKVKAADTFLLFVLFGTHRMYRVRLQSVRVRGEVYLSDFRELVKNFLAEWSDSNLLATVFVGANIAFLAVPDITDLQRTASLASTIFSVLSVATGVHHVWHHRTKSDASIEDAQRYMNHGRSSDSQDSDLAVIAYFLSVPLVALLYAVLSFSIALAAFCIQNSGDVHGKILLSVVLGVLGTAGLGTLLFFWHVWRGPRTEEIWEEDSRDVVDYGWVTRARGLVTRINLIIKGWLQGAKRERDQKNVGSV